MAGCFYAVYKSSTFPGDFQLNISIFILCMVILGGMGNVWGVMLGGFVLAYLNFQGLGAIGNQFNSTFNANINVGTYQYGIFGIVIVTMMLLRPQGLIPGKRRALELTEVGVHDQSLFDAEHDEAPVE
jgi:branched-chain amino acid transport system permease protein